MKQKRFLMFLSFLASLIFFGISQAAPIPGTAGTTTLQDGPNTEGLYFEIDVYYEVFDGKDATDPLGVTPGKKQFAYILEYVAGNEYCGRLDIQSINGVPLSTTGTSTSGTINETAAGETAPRVHGITTISGDPAASYLFTQAGSPFFGGVGERSVILIYTADETYDIGTALAQIINTSLSCAGEVAGPTECFGIIEGSVLCTECDPQGQFLPMEGVTVVVSKDGNEVASAVTDENGKYMFAGLETGQFTVSVQDAENYTACAATSMDVEVACSGSAIANFCVCPPPCTQQICVRVVCDANGEEEAVAYPWIGICGPEILQWSNAGRDGEKCFNGQNIV
ncbi:MAG: carboxypeptidase-like regulatory domain-containing protein, partial [Phycisphaerae bacterium]